MFVRFFWLGIIIFFLVVLNWCRIMHDPVLYLGSVCIFLTSWYIVDGELCFYLSWNLSSGPISVCVKSIFPVTGIVPISMTISSIDTPYLMFFWTRELSIFTSLYSFNSSFPLLPMRFQGTCDIFLIGVLVKGIPFADKGLTWFMYSNLLIFDAGIPLASYTSPILVYDNLVL